jgi:hypothetical protein
MNMIHDKFIASSTLMAALIFSAASGRSQELSQSEKAKRAAEYTALAGPGPEHQRLQSLAGKWDMEIKYWMQPGKPPIALKATCENRMILGGRFLISESKGSMGGMSIESTSIFGFDRRHKKYTTVGLDTMGTYYVTATGPYDESKQAAIMYGEDFDPVLGQTQKYDMIVRFLGPDKYLTEIVFKDKEHTHGAAEFKVIEITHTRQK